MACPSFLDISPSIHPSIWQPITSLIDAEIRSEPKVHAEWRRGLIVDKNFALPVRWQIHCIL